MTDYEVIVIGAGVCGIYQVHRLVELGVTTTVLEAGDDLGGTWFWNRYPGARFDSESVTYGYSFSGELLQEWDWKERFSGQPENLRYLNHVVDKFDLRKHMQFGCTVESAHFDDEASAWRLRLDDGRELTCRFLVTALGLLSAPTHAALRRHGRVRGSVLPHLPLARGAGGARRQASGGDRHRRHRRAGDRRDRRQGRRAVRVPAAAELVRSAAQRRDLRRRDGRHQDPLRRDLRHLRADAGRLHPRAGPAAVLRGATRGAAGDVGEALRRAGVRHLAGQLPRHVHGRGGQRRALRVHRRQDPLTGPRPGRRREADPQGPRLRRAARPARDRLLRGVQPGQRAPGRSRRGSDRTHHPPRDPHSGPRVRARRHRLCHWLRRRHRRVRSHRHPRRRRPVVAREVGR